VRELLPLVEHVLGEVALEAPGHRDGGDVVEDAGVDGVGEVDGVLGPAHVEQRVARLVGGHVVDRGEVEDVLDALQRLAVGLRDAEHRLREVAHHGLDPLGGAPAGDQLVELLPGALADEDVDVSLALEQALDQVPADEAGRPRDEVAQRFLLLGPLMAREPIGAGQRTRTVAVRE
jgi:hypothetical protein